MERQLPPFDFSILRILDCGFTINELVAIEKDKIKIGYGMNFQFDVENNWIEYVVKAEFKHTETDFTFLSGSALTRFGVNNLSAFVDENDKVIFPTGSVEALFGIAFTHMRAILSKNVAGSRFSTIIVPIINPAPIFHELLKMHVDAFKKATQKKTLKQEEKSDYMDIQLTNSAQSVKGPKKVRT